MSAACLTKGGGLSCPRQVMQEGCIRGLLHQAQTGRAYAPLVASPSCDQNLRVLELKMQQTYQIMGIKLINDVNHSISI